MIYVQKCWQMHLPIQTHSRSNIFAISVKRNAIYFLKIILSMHLTIQHNDRVLQVTKNLMNHKSLK